MIKFVSNIDTICILVDIENYEEENIEVMKFLMENKEEAKKIASENSQGKHFITFNDIVFQILPNSCQGYAFILKNNSYELKISQYKSKIKSFYPIQVRISAETLWSEGIYKSWAIIYNWITETFGNIADNKVCRLDICTHISDIDFITNYDTVYKGKYKKTQIFHTGRNINCLCFGSRKGKNIYCRIYNKTLEVQETKKKNWFKEIWQKNGLNIDNVWNVEFEIKSELLRKYNLCSVLDIINSLKDIWQYCTQEWLVKIDRINERVERCPINKSWLEIQHCYDNFKSKELIERDKQNEIEAETLIPNIVGNITSYSARKNNLEINDAFAELLKNTMKYLAKKRTSFETEVSKKQKIMNKTKESE